ncbi:hypothetical protein EJ03DRAFT_121552 [Teratosphaeria nubilosa]|uniref:Secreted protein n=1 Tax=Teratosphaeria nubilosa TaxID=161662 RepID=A0A6G1L6W5_9PEZI|nr:hypothetical protein EJ03DRAFT_121552 [Teratosphaeria nubilosa]
MRSRRGRGLRRRSVRWFALRLTIPVLSASLTAESECTCRVRYHPWPHVLAGSMPPRKIRMRNLLSSQVLRSNYHHQLVRHIPGSVHNETTDLEGNLRHSSDQIPISRSSCSRRLMLLWMHPKIEGYCQFCTILTI